MQKPLALLCLGSFAGAARVTLREGETGRLGDRKVTVLEVQDRRCGPNEDCLADVVARVRVQRGGQTSSLTLGFPPERVLRWSGAGAAKVSGGAVTLSSQPPGSKAAGKTLTLRRGEMGWVGPRHVKVLGMETRECPSQLLGVRPVVTAVDLDVRWGQQNSWLALEYPAAAAPTGLRLVQVTEGPRPAPTLPDVGE